MTFPRARATATAMPWITPRNATPRTHTIESQTRSCVSATALWTPAISTRLREAAPGWVDPVATPDREGPRQHTGVGEGDQGDPDRAGGQGGHGGGRPLRQREGGEPLGEWAHQRQPRPLGQAQDGHRDRRGHDRHQDPGELWPPAFAAQDHDKAEEPDPQRHRVGLPSSHPLDEPAGLLEEAVGIPENPNSLGSWPTRAVRRSRSCTHSAPAWTTPR